MSDCSMVRQAAVYLWASRGDLGSEPSKALGDPKPHMTRRPMLDPCMQGPVKQQAMPLRQQQALRAWRTGIHRQAAQMPRAQRHMSTLRQRVCKRVPPAGRLWCWMCGTSMNGMLGTSKQLSAHLRWATYPSPRHNYVRDVMAVMTYPCVRLPVVVAIWLAAASTSKASLSGLALLLSHGAVSASPGCCWPHAQLS